jgi:hypothetical protein
MYSNTFPFLIAEVERLKMEKISTPVNVCKEWNNDSEVREICLYEQ